MIGAEHAASAAAPGSLGAPAEIAISSDAQANLQFFSNSAYSNSSWSLLLEPSIDYFFARDVSLGASVGWQHVSASGNPSTNSWSASVGAGYNLAISDRVSIWPKVRVGYYPASILSADLQNSGPLVFGETSSDGLLIGAFAPVLLHPAPHFFLGLGPSIQSQVLGWPTQHNRVTQYGLTFVVGGWFGGAP